MPRKKLAFLLKLPIISGIVRKKVLTGLGLDAAHVAMTGSAPIPAELFTAQAERRVRLGLIVSELVRSNNLLAKPEQLRAHIEELAQSYEKPAEVMRYYLSDRDRMAEVEAIVVEGNVADFVMSRAKISEKVLPFDELMASA